MLKIFLFFLYLALPINQLEQNGVWVKNCVIRLRWLFLSLLSFCSSNSKCSGKDFRFLFFALSRCMYATHSISLATQWHICFGGINKNMFAQIHIKRTFAGFYLLLFAQRDISSSFDTFDNCHCYAFFSNCV